MTAVTGRRMAETVARRGGLAVLPQDVPSDVLAGVVARVKASSPVLETALTLGPGDTVTDALHLLPKRAHGALVVVRDGRPVGVVTEPDCRGVDRFTQLREVMSPDPLTLDAGDVEAPGGLRSAFDTLHAARRAFAPVVRDGPARGRDHPHRCAAVDDLPPGPGRRRPAAGGGRRRHQRGRGGQGAGGPGRRGRRARRRHRHGHQERMLDALRVVGALRPGVPVVAGNVVTAAGVRDLVEAGADIVKVGVGPVPCAPPG
jgi:IMP dehydrogenase